MAASTQKGATPIDRIARPRRRGNAGTACAAALLALIVALVVLPGRGEAALGARWLERGDRGVDVRDLQRALRRLGYGVDVDGQFGPRTERAVRRYERAEGLTVDGQVSQGQGKGMARRVRQRSRTGGERRGERGERAAFGRSTLQRGDRGAGVERLQDVLSQLGYRLGSDGVFGSVTESRVREYERKEQIRVDGRVSGGQARGMQRRLEEHGGVQPPDRDRTPTGVADGRFPIAGPWSWGGEGSGFGERGGAHKGVDVFAPCATPLVAVESGTVVFTAFHERAGHYVVIRGARSTHDHVYMHLQGPTPVGRGRPVRAGQSIGAVGDSGNARGCHLHFEMWSAPGWYEGGSAFDPRPSLERWAQSTRAARARRRY